MQTTSVLPYPVFVNGENYNGRPGIAGNALLRRELLEHLVPVAAKLPRAVFLPLGPVPSKALEWLVQQGKLDARRALPGLLIPAPPTMSASLTSRRKPAGLLSKKTNAAQIDEARAGLQGAVVAL